MKYPSCILKGEYARGTCITVAGAGKGQIQDTGAKMIHLAPHTKSNIISKSIGISIGEGKMDIIVRAWTEIPLPNEKVLAYYKEYSLKRNNKNKMQIINIYEGYNENVSDNKLLGMFSIQLGKNNEEKKIKISMSIDHNSILKVIGFVNNEKNVEQKIDMSINDIDEEE